MTGGTRPGGGTNLFHSFGNFNVPNNNVANFLNETGLPTSNILGRVTGGNISNIFGMIQTTGFGNANLFLINPAGFLFGPNATVNVGGMVAFTSADYLRLADGVRFNATPNATADALLTPSPVAAFGFLGSNPGAITVQGSQFTVTEGTGISLVGGNITIQSGTLDNGTVQPARLSAPNGKIQLATAASPGEFDAATLQPLPNVNGSSFTSFGSVTLAPGSNINVSGANTVSIRGGQFVLSVRDATISTAESAGPPETISLSRGSSLVTSNSGPESGADVLMAAATIQLDGTLIGSTTSGDGSGGNITLHTDQIGLTGGTQIITNTEGAGAGGTITLAATDSITISGLDSGETLISPLGLPTSGILSLASGTGAGGDVNVSAPSITVEHNGLLMSINSGDGRGGNLSLTGRAIGIQDEAIVLSSTGQDFFTGEIKGGGAGGNIALSASDSLRIIGPETQTFLGMTGINSQSINTGEAGNISASAPVIAMERGGTISTFNAGTGAGGNISVSAPTSLTIAGVDQALGQVSMVGTSTISEANSGNITIEAGSLHLSDRGSVNTVSNGVGNSNPGDINLHIAGDLTVTEGGAIYSSGNTNSSGTIRISADSVLISGRQPFTPSLIETNGGAVSTGNIEITSRVISVSDDARINMFGIGQLGTISLVASEAVNLSNGGKLRMENASGAPGTAGSINVSAPSITLDQAIIQTLTVGPGDAGSVTLEGNRIALLGGQINSETQNVIGRGGDVTVIAQESLLISGQLAARVVDTTHEAGGPAGIFSSTRGLGGDAGNISIHAPHVQITDGGVLMATSSGTGNAGTITVQGLSNPAQSVLIDGAGSGIFTDTQGTGAGGNININANSVTLQNGGTLSAATSGTAPSATGGTITIAATDVQLSNFASITAQTTGAGDAGAINITADNSVSLTAGSTISSSSPLGFSNGNGGPVTITASTVSLQDSSITTFADGFGSDFSTAGAGAVTISASTSLSLVSGTIDSHITDTAGNAGQILITSPSVSLSNASTISSATFTNSFNPDGSAVGLHTDGNGGLVELAVGQLSLADFSQITTQTNGGGQGGNVSVHGLAGPSSPASDVTIMSGAAIRTDTNDIGAAGNITIDTARLAVTGGGQIQATTGGSGAGGTITIRATEQVTVSGEVLGCSDCPVGGRTSPSQITASSSRSDGHAGDILVETPSLTLADGGQIVASTSGAGQGGTVTVQGLHGAGSMATSFLVSGQSSEGAVSGLFTDTHGTGAGGDIVVNANSVTLQNGGTLSAATSGTAPSATGGTITVNANQVRLNNGGLITAASTGAGAGGSITIGADSTFASNAGTVSSTATQATGGDITITAGQSVTLDNGSLITASSSGPGDAGNILINAGHNYTSTNSAVTTRATAPNTDASGGNITVLATDMVQLTNSQLDASVQGSLTTVGGNITIDPQYVILINSQILAQASQGQGGVISINITNGGLYLPDAISTVSASSQFGVNGTVTIQSPNAPASGKINPLSQKPLIATSLLSQRCAALASGELSSLTVAGRDSLPAEPGSWLSTPLALSSEFGDGTLTQGGAHTSLNDPQEERPLLSLRQIAPPGFLIRSFAVEGSVGCSS
ncbi:MAG TPA: filamentous hemagglutinin N-terminal domain-containing protein [Nitrospira sp.]|nr:filamentous hemagglutinin N-terminal domain-containing protein [Nitrospira sp.]